MRGFVLFAPFAAFVACSSFGADDGTTPSDGGASETGGPLDGGGLSEGGSPGCLGSASFLCDDFDDDNALGSRWSNLVVTAPAEILRNGLRFSSPARSLLVRHPDIDSGPNVEAALRKSFPAARAVSCTFRFFIVSLTATSYDVPVTLFADQGTTESVNVDWNLGGGLCTLGVSIAYSGGPNEEYYPDFTRPPAGKWVLVGLDVDYAMRRASISIDGATVIVRSWNRQVTPDREELRLGMLTGADTTAAELSFDDVKCDFQP